MPVNTEHCEYAGISQRAKKVRDFMDGGSKVKPYIHQLPGHTPEIYKKYQDRAYYLPALARTVDAFVGMIMQPQPIVHNAEEAFKPYLDDLTYDGEPFNRVAAQVVEKVIASARCVMVVDYPSAGTEKLSVLEAEKKGLRAYARLYNAEDLIDWRVSSSNGERYTTQLRLKETYEVQNSSDEFEFETKTQYRVLEIVDGKYQVRIFRDIDGVDVQYGETIQPLSNGKPLDFIPAVVFGPSSLDASMVEFPPVYELTEVAQSHLNDSADRQWALAWCGCPTPVFTGITDAEFTFALGASQGIALAEGGTATLLTMTSDAVGALRDSMEDKRRDMAAIGARLLVDESKVQVAFETAQIQRAGEHSILSGVANTVADGLTQILRMLAAWSGKENKEIRVELNTEFIPKDLTPDEMRADMEAVQSGYLSSTDAFHKWQKRGAIRSDKTFEDHQEEIEDDKARLALEPNEDED